MVLASFAKFEKPAVEAKRPDWELGSHPYYLILWEILVIVVLQTSSESLLDPQQAQAFDQLCRLYRGTSRLALLTELSRDRGGEKHGLLHVSQGDPALNSVFQNETFQLHLTPPPVLDE
ncbi:UNVERIFIED_CONTAM: Vacuolar protein sorting-associated protein 8 [Gekko kuhli]